MNILFTINTGIISKMIRKITGESFSHVAIRIDEFVIHSNFKGLHIELLETFLKKNVIIRALERPYGDREQEDNNRVFDLLASKEFSSYDFGAFAFLGLSLFCRLVGLTWFRSNLWQSSGAFLCTEWASEVSEGAPDGLVTPGELYKRLKAKEQWIDI